MGRAESYTVRRGCGTRSPDHRRDEIGLSVYHLEEQRQAEVSVHESLNICLHIS